QAEDGIRDLIVTGVQTCALPICEQAECGQEKEPVVRAALHECPLVRGVSARCIAADRGAICKRFRDTKSTGPPVPGRHNSCSFTDRKSTRLNSSHDQNSYAVFCF